MVHAELVAFVGYVAFEDYVAFAWVDGLDSFLFLGVRAYLKFALLQGGITEI